MLSCKKIFITTIIVSILLFSFLFFSKDNYYCENLDSVKKCAKLSPTEKTCYPHYNDYRNKKLCQSNWINSNEIL